MQRQKPIKYVVAMVFVFILLLMLFIGGKKIKQRWIIERTLQSEHWQKREKEIESAPLGKYKTIFFGNSLTEMWDVNYYFNDSTILNAGITGDFSEGLLKRCSTIINLKPEKLFIEIGINDMIEKISLNEICSNYEQLITLIKKESPQTNVYIQSNLPLIVNRPSLLTNDEDVNALVRKQNENLKLLAQKYNCMYVDIYSEMIKEKDRSSLFIWDGLHLTPKAYTIWLNALKGFIQH